VNIPLSPLSLQSSHLPYRYLTIIAGKNNFIIPLFLFNDLPFTAPHDKYNDPVVKVTGHSNQPVPHKNFNQPSIEKFIQSPHKNFQPDLA